MPPSKLFAAVVAVLLSCLQVPAAPLSGVTLSIRSSTLLDSSERNYSSPFLPPPPPPIPFSLHLQDPLAQRALNHQPKIQSLSHVFLHSLGPQPPLQIPSYDCDGCGFVLITSNSSAAASLDAQFSFVNASLSSSPAVRAAGLLLQLKASAFPVYPALLSCTLCLVPYTPSLPAGSHSIIMSTHTAALLPNASACPGPAKSCPLTFQPFDASAPVDSAAAFPLSIPPTATFSPNSIPASSTRTLLATFPNVSFPPSASFTAVSSGSDFGCGLTSAASQCAAGSSNVYCWGSYNLNSKWYPTQVALPVGTSGVSVCAGFDHACAVTNGGDVYCWGRNLESQCGSNVSAYVAASEPLLVPGVVGAKVVKCGKFSTCASVGTGSQHRLFCWGNAFGPGGGYPSIQPDIYWPSPALLPLPANKALKEGVDTFSTGSFTGCAVVADTVSASTSLWCWGDIKFVRPNGFTGAIPYDASAIPIPDAAATDVKAVSVGASHACVVDAVGGLYCWGANVFCQLGNSTSCKLSSSNPPQPLPVQAQQQLSQKFSFVTVSDRHTCAITDSKALYCWGQNNNGFLGSSSAPLAVVPTPVLVTLNASALSVSAASFTSGPATCAITDAPASKLYCWGYSFFGAVGIGPVTQSQAIVREPALVAQVVAVGSIVARTVANASMWTQGLGAAQTTTRTLRGGDVLVVLTNESAAEFDVTPSAFDLEMGKTALVDLTTLPQFPINCATYTGSLAISAFVPCSQRSSCSSCEPGFGSKQCKWCTSDVYNPVSGFCSQSTCPGSLFTLTSIQYCTGSSRPDPTPSRLSPDELSCAGRACGWPGSVDNAAAAGVAAFVLCFILSVLQPYVVLSFHAHRIILSKREAAQLALAGPLEPPADAPAVLVPTYAQLLCPIALNCRRNPLYSSMDSVSIETLARNANQHPTMATMVPLPPAVHASGHVDADFDGPWGEASPLQRIKIVWRRLIPAYIAVFGVYFATAFIFFKYVVYDNEGHVKPWKGSCFSVAEMQENICVFAAGQGAYGLIAVGQAAVGLIVIAQGSVGLIAAVGQGALSLGFSAGQVATGCFVEACQIGVALVDIKRCMLGLRAFAWIRAPLHRVESTFIATCLCNQAARDQRGSQEANGAVAADAAAVVAAAIAAAAAVEASADDQRRAAADSPPAERAAYVRAPRRVVPGGPRDSRPPVLMEQV